MIGALGYNNGIDVIHDFSRGYAHIQPLPNDTDVASYYNDDDFYNRHSPSDWFPKEKREHRLGLWDAYYQHQASLMNAHLPLIDVGCGTGYFLKYWIEGGNNGMGIEPSLLAIRNSRLPRHHLLTQSNQLGAEWLNSSNVNINLVLEHVYDPVSFLRRYASYLADDGHMVIVVPNDFSTLQYRVLNKLKCHQWWINRVHLNYFTPQSLRRVINDAGLDVVYETATFPMELFLLAGINYLENDTIGKRVHNFRLKAEKVFGQKMFWLYKKLYDRRGFGRELVFVARKKA